MEVSRSNLEPLRSSKSRFWDKVLLVGAASIVCVIGVASFTLAESFHVNPGWVFFAGNSILMIPILAREFRGYWKKPAFIIFFLVWMAVHGFTGRYSFFSSYPLVS